MLGWWPSPDVFADGSSQEKDSAVVDDKKETLKKRKRLVKKRGDPNQLPVLRNHVCYALVDTQDYKPTANPTSIPAKLDPNGRWWGHVYGCYLPLKIIRDRSSSEWPTQVEFDRTGVEHSKRRLELDAIVASYFYNLKDGLIGAGEYRLHLSGRIFEEGTLRAGLLRPRYYHLATFSPRYLVGVTKRCEAFIDCCYQYTNELLQTYQLSVVEPLPSSPHRESIYHGIQHLWYYKHHDDGYNMRQWTLGFQNLPIDQFGVPPERRLPHGRGRKEANAELSPQCFGLGTCSVYTHSYQSSRRGTILKWKVTEVARYYWYGVEKSLPAYLSLLWSDHQYSCAIKQWVTHIKDIGTIILAYAIDGCFHCCTTSLPKPKS